VRVKKGSVLSSVSGCDSAVVTTNHHQAVERLSTQLAANAYSSDNLIEGFEPFPTSGKGSSTFCCNFAFPIIPKKLFFSAWSHTQVFLAYLHSCYKG